jgi:hypothetical protein
MSTTYLWQSAYCKSKIKKSENKLEIDYKNKYIVLSKEEIESVKLIKTKNKKLNILAVGFPTTVIAILFLNYEFELFHFVGSALLLLPFFAFAYYFKFNDYSLVLITTNKQQIRIDATTRKRKEIKALFYFLNNWKTKKSVFF